MEKRLISYKNKLAQKEKNITIEIENCTDYVIEEVSDKFTKFINDLKLEYKNVTIREEDRFIRYDKSKVPAILLYYLTDKVGTEVYYKQNGKISKCMFEAVFYDIHEGVTLCLENYDDEISIVSGVDEIGMAIFFDEKDAKNN